MEEAERIAREEHDSWKIAVIAGSSPRTHFVLSFQLKLNSVSCFRYRNEGLLPTAGIRTRWGLYVQDACLELALFSCIILSSLGLNASEELRIGRGRREGKKRKIKFKLFKQRGC